MRIQKLALSKERDVICILFVSRVKNLGIGWHFLVDTLEASLLSQLGIRQVQTISKNKANTTMAGAQVRRCICVR